MDFEVELLGESSGVRALRATVERLLSGRSGVHRLPAVLIQGETGTGKGLLARGLHRASVRGQGPLVDVNCAAIPETMLEAELFGFERGAFTDAKQAKPGLVQAAHRGTLFLDEIGLLSPALQAKLLKVLEDKTVRRLGSTRSEPVDVWVISATNEDLAEAIRERRFREDLYHRLAVITLELPPLRTRGGDVLLLAEHFLERACADYGLSPIRLAADARAALAAYPWPGNVRELSNVIERAALLADASTLAAAHLALPGAAEPTGPEGASVPQRLERVLGETGWNISRTAAVLGVTRNTVKARMVRYGLREGRDDKPAPSHDAVPSVSPPAAPARREGLRWERRWIAALRVVVQSAGAASLYQLAPVLDELTIKAESLGARVADLDPGGFTAVYGLEPMEDASHRAALTAQAIHTTLQRATTEGLAAEGLVVRAAVHVAECLIARGALVPGMDTGDRRRVGETLDALLERTPAGATVVSADGARSLRRAFELESLGDDGGGTAAYRVARYVRSEFQAGGRSRSPFVGRDRELSLLDGLLARAESGRGQLVGLVGEPGVGKSRLLYEFRQGLGRDRVTYLEGHCAAYGHATPYLPIIALSHEALRFAESDAPATVAERVGGEVSGLGLPSDAIVPYVLHMLGLTDESRRALPPLSPEAMRTRTTEALRQLLVAGGQRRPMVVAIEDLQWIDPTSEEILAALAESVAACSILFLATYRHGYQPPWLGKSYASQLVLHRLRPTESRTIVAAAGRTETLRADVLDEIIARADGNPFFLEELARAVSEGEGASASPTIPDTIEGVLTARLDRLPPMDRDLLQAAAVVGKDGAVSLLKAVAGLGDAEFAATLARLRAAEFLHETAVIPARHYAFEHVLTQEVAYRSLPPERRRALHAASASAIERLMPASAERSPELLARHCAEGGLVREAIAYWHRAGQFATQRSAYAEAIEHLTRGLELMETLPHSPDRAQKELGLRLALAAALMATQGFASDQVDATLARAREIVGHLGDSPQLFPVRFGLWRLSLVRAQLFAADEATTGLLEMAERAQEPALLMAANVATGATAFYRGQFVRAHAHLERGLGLHRDEFGPTQVLAYGQNLAAGALGYLAATQAIRGELDQAAAGVDRALELARGCGHPFTLAFGLMLAGNVRQLRGEAALTGPLGEELLALSREQGFVYFVNIALSLTGWAQATEDPRGRGLDRMREGARGYQVLHHRLVPAHRTYLAEALVRAGLVDEALEVIETGLTHASERGEESHLADLHRVKGEALARLSRAADAQASFRLAFDIASRQGARLFALRAATASVTLSAETMGGVPAADRARLSGLYAELTEGLDLDDLRAARRLM